MGKRRKRGKNSGENSEQIDSPLLFLIGSVLFGGITIGLRVWTGSWAATITTELLLILAGLIYFYWNPFARGCKRVWEVAFVEENGLSMDEGEKDGKTWEEKGADFTIDISEIQRLQKTKGFEIDNEDLSSEMIKYMQELEEQGLSKDEKNQKLTEKARELIDERIENIERTGEVPVKESDEPRYPYKMWNTDGDWDNLDEHDQMDQKIVRHDEKFRVPTDDGYRLIEDPENIQDEHDGCNCTAIPLLEKEALERGYEPSEQSSDSLEENHDKT